jgi:mono/diheme cytochrome c family protein
MRLHIRISSALLVSAVLSAGGGRAVHAQKIFSGGYTQQNGEDLYKGICQGCHMPDAQGALGAGAYPALANNARLKSALYPVGIVLNGQRAMPPFGADLSDAQIASVLNYVRGHFGNHYKDPISAADVKAVRSSSAEP